MVVLLLLSAWSSLLLIQSLHSPRPYLNHFLGNMGMLRHKPLYKTHHLVRLEHPRDNMWRVIYVGANDNSLRFLGTSAARGAGVLLHSNILDFLKRYLWFAGNSNWLELGIIAQ